MRLIQGDIQSWELRRAPPDIIRYPTNAGFAPSTNNYSNITIILNDGDELRGRVIDLDCESIINDIAHINMSIAGESGEEINASFECTVTDFNKDAEILIFGKETKITNWREEIER